MDATLPAPAEEYARQRDALAERLLNSTRGTFDIFTIYLGDRLGFYRALAEVNGRGLTPAELAARTGTVERYAREWLEQQTVMGTLSVEAAEAGPEARRYHLPPGHAEVLVEKDSLNYLAPLAQLAVSVTRPLEALMRAYRQGGGVPLDQYGADFREGQAGVNRAAFLQQLGREWLPAIPDIHARLQAPARVADIGCGAGWSSIGLARAYPQVRVDGYDLDAPSVAMARANAAEAGVSDRVAFHVRDAADPALAGRYDLVMALEAVHDMANPVGALRTMRQLAGPRGAVIIVDERVGDTFTPSGNDVEWMMYGWSVLHCLPVGMAEQPSAGTGTVMRAGTLRGYALEAGFRDVEVLPIDNLFFRFYRLHP